MFEAAAQEGVALLFPDTSPRGAKIEGEDDSYDFGSGAGFYINATKEPWNKHYNMYDHVTKELPQVLCLHLKLFKYVDCSNVFIRAPDLL